MRRLALAVALPLALGTLALGALGTVGLASAQDGLPTPPVAPADPAQARDPRLEALVGTWIGRGTLLGQPTLEVWSVAWTLDRAFLSVVATRTVVGDDARATTEHQLFLRPSAPGGYRGAWVDSAGGLATVKATWTKDAAGEGLLVELSAQDGARLVDPPAARWLLSGAPAQPVLDVRRLDAQGAEVGKVTLERKDEKKAEGEAPEKKE